jgi:Fur family ferric uptake transcriptional regulator
VPTTSDYERVLRGAGLRVIDPRLAVLSVVPYQPHTDTDRIIAAVRKESGRVSRQAAYDVLHALTAAVWCGASSRRASWLATRRVAGRPPPCRVPVVWCHRRRRRRPRRHRLPDGPDTSGYDIGEAEVICWGRCPAGLAGTTSSG